MHRSCAEGQEIAIRWRASASFIVVTAIQGERAQAPT
jgi:hypothetical protein